MSTHVQSPRSKLWEWVAAACLLALAGALIFFSKGVPVSYQVVLWGAWLAVLAFVFRRGWIRLFGPVLFYDLIRTGRRTRNILLRCIYALALFLMVYTVYLEYADNLQRIWATRFRMDVDSAQARNQLIIQEMAKFAESFFMMFMEVQFIGVFLLTPAFAAGAIAEEKDRKTLDFLLATDLSDREIVLGKMASRVLSLALLVMTGLPILSLIQFWGGVDPDLVLSGFAATGLTMLSLAGLSILASVYTKKPRDAIVLSYLMVVIYLGISGIGYWMDSSPRLGTRLVSPTSWDDWPALLLQDWLPSGNLFVMVDKLREAQAKGTLLNQVLPNLLGSYAIFHGSLAFLFTLLAVTGMRVVAMAQTTVRKRPAGNWQWIRRPAWLPRPAFRGRPMLWKELILEPGLGFNRLGRIIIALIIFASFIPAARIAWNYLFEAQHLQPWVWVEDAINQWVRSVGTIVASLVLLGIGIRASGAVSGEREKQTLDSLLTSSLQTKEILFAKWLGSILSVRWALLWLCIIWALGAVTGGLDRTCLPWLVVAWCVYASFMAAMGLYFSTVHSTTQRASIWTLTVTAFIFGGHWAFSYLFCLALPTGGMGPAGAPNPAAEWPWYLQRFGMTPPVAMSWLAFRAESFHIGFLQSLTGSRDDAMGVFLGIVIGLLIWAGISWWLWKATIRRFNLLAGRRKVHVLDKTFVKHYPKFRPAVSSQ
jgi:ABC-type transport system involved in multi-copper enzyme maturation permease subunit